MTRGQNEVEKFKEAILGNLNNEQNKRKGSWLRTNTVFLLWSLFVEYCELFKAVFLCLRAEHKFNKNPTTKRHDKWVLAKDRVLSEAADNGAYAMMIADKLGALGE